MDTRQRRRTVVLVLGFAMLATVACSKAPKRAPTPSPATGGLNVPVGPLVTPQQLAEQPGGVETVRVAYNLLLDQYVKPLKSSDLLQAAWNGVLKELQLQGGVDTGNAPRFTGDRTADFKAFSASFGATATRGDPSSYGYAAVQSMAASLQDDHTAFLAPAEYKQQQSDLLSTSTIPPFSFAMLPAGIGYLKLSHFPTAFAKLPDGKTLAEDLDTALATLDAQGVKGWLLDLRDDDGGSTDSIATLTGRFIPQGLVAVFLDGRGQHLELPVDGHAFLHRRPLAVLINGKTSSAAEISAAAFKEYATGRLFGTQTAGEVNGATEFPLPGGAALEYTILQVRTGKGLQPLDGIGVKPDEAVPAENGADAQAKAAEAWLAGQTSTPATAPSPVATSLSPRQISSALSPYGARLTDLPAAPNLRLLGEQSLDTPVEYAQFAPQALQLAQTARQRGWQGEFNQYFGNTDPYTYQLSIDMYHDAAGAQQAIQTNDLPQQYTNVTPPAPIGDQTVAQNGIVSSLGQTRLEWRRGRLVFTLLYVSEPGLESFTPLLMLARAVDARYQQNPLR